MSKKIVFLTGTRADYGKIKPLMLEVEKNPNLDLHIYATGMHLIPKFGLTIHEIEKDGFKNIYKATIRPPESSMSYDTGWEICHFTKYIEKVKPDLIIVHGDRLEALAGATVGALNNIPVAHIEGGEVSGTIDESIRHAVSKLAHIHFVANTEAQNRILQLGEAQDQVYIIGSPDIDIMHSEKLPSIEAVKRHYNIPFGNYSIMIVHPITTNYPYIQHNATVIVDSAIASGRNFIVIYPNNDWGHESILNIYRQKLTLLPNFKLFPSIRFECFLTLLQHAECIYGNSSAGIREAGIYGIPAIDVGIRQQGRYNSSHRHIIHCPIDETKILQAFHNLPQDLPRITEWGEGNSASLFSKIIADPYFWKINFQKRFVDRRESKDYV